MKKTFFSLSIAFCCASLAPCLSHAQTSYRQLQALRKQRQKAVAQYGQSATGIVSRYRNSLAASVPHGVADAVSLDSMTLSPYMFPVIGPGVYYKSVTADVFALDYRMPGDDAVTAVSPVLAYREMMGDNIQHALSGAYAASPWLFSYNDDMIDREEVIEDTKPVTEVKPEDLDKMYSKVDEITDVKDVVSDMTIDLKIEKPNFWSTKCEFNFKFSQNYFSEQWYKGGNNNVNLFTNLILEANYNDQKAIQWDNKLDMRLGFITASSDSIHNFLTSDDRIYLFSKLGVRAVENWYYTLSTEAKTQFLPGYRSNDRNTYSDFLAPLDAYVAIGIDFKPKLKNGNSLSAVLQPLTYKIRYIGAEDETIHASYNMRDKDFQQDFGSKVEVNAFVNVMKNFTWRSRLFFFTSYEYVESEWENNFSFSFNKYIKADLYTTWRFDDNRNKKYYDSTLGYFQFKETFMLGLTYSF